MLLIDSHLLHLLGTLLVCNRLGIICPLLLRILHEDFILFLRMLLIDSHLLHLLVKVRHQQIHHSNHSTLLLALFLVGSPRLWGGWWSNIASDGTVGSDLCKH